MKKTVLILLFCLPTLLFSQNCNCTSNFNWLKTTFEKNDAGFSYAISKKGEQAYEMHNKVFIKKTANVTSINDCQKLMAEWLAFFRSGHLKIKNINKSKLNTKKENRKLPEIYFKTINKQTVYLRISTFSGAVRKTIDSVILKHKKTILKTPNFIIDIRNNGGGSDSSYRKLLPLLYTNPIRSIGIEFLSTTLNNQRMLDFINNPKWGFDQDGKKWAKQSFDKLEKQKGSFVNLSSTMVDEIKYDTIYKFPKRVGIIINGKNGSTAEQFLLDAKQSKKVKLFGTTTKGVLDISNMHFVTFPSRKFELGYGLSRSMRIPEMAIDEKGIQPDFFLDEEIKKEDWIEFVTKSLEK